MSGQTLWDRVDGPILGWVASLGSVLQSDNRVDLELREPERFEPVPSLTSRDVQQSLRRLDSYGLIEAIESAAFGNSSWSRLRVTARGLIVLGEWPDLDRVANAASLHRLAAGVVARYSDEVLRGTAADLAGAAGEKAAGG
jgi:hypothetical protein